MATDNSTALKFMDISNEIGYSAHQLLRLSANYKLDGMFLNLWYPNDLYTFNSQACVVN
jgi:hypothetical protein